MPQDIALRRDDIWWQGENARIASLAAAARLAARYFGPDTFADRLRSYALDQLNWILGLNPFNVCMLDAGTCMRSPPAASEVVEKAVPHSVASASTRSLRRGTA